MPDSHGAIGNLIEMEKDLYFTAYLKVTNTRAVKH